MHNKYSDLKYTKMVLSMIDKSVGLDVLNNYVNGVIARDYVEFKSVSQVNSLFKDSIDEFLDSLSYDELMDLRSYTGYNYKFINAILRGNLTYDEHGILDENKRNEYKRLSMKINGLLDRFNTPDIDFMCFRGTTFGAFNGHGITNLSQLENLKGQYLYERSFTSTSIIKESSYINKRLDDGRYCNVGIIYLIPSESNDGALLISNDTSYSINQNEFLLNSGALSKVIDVEIDEINNTAILTVLLIPKGIYELSYNKENNIKR